MADELFTSNAKELVRCYGLVRCSGICWQLEQNTRSEHAMGKVGTKMLAQGAVMRQCDIQQW